MADEDQRAGTEAGSETGDATNAATESREPVDDGDAGQQPDYKRMYLESKSKVERANKLETENAELRERLERGAQTQPPAAQTTAADPQAQIANQLDRDIAETRYVAQLTDEQVTALYGAIGFDMRRQARVQLANLEATLRANVRAEHETAFAKMGEWEEVARAEFQTGDYRTPQAALKAAKAKKLEAERADLDKQRKELDAQRERMQNGTETFTRGVGAREAKEREMPHGKWMEEMTRAREAGDRKRMAELKAIDAAGGVT